MAKAKKAAPARAPEVKKFLQPLAHEINVRLDKAEQIQDKADDHRLAAALKLEEARKKCAAQKVNFKKWCEANVKHAYESVRKLVRIGGAKDPKLALEDLRGRTARYVAALRERKAKHAADPKAVAETAIALMKEPEAVKFIGDQAKKYGVAGGSGDELADAKFDFDVLKPAQKIEMANRNLTPDELKKANALLKEVRTRLKDISDGDAALLFAYRRKIAKELGYDERGKPIDRKILKARKMGEQGGICPICSRPLPEKNAVLDRLNGMGGYTPENTRLIHAECDRRIQAKRGYR